MLMFGCKGLGELGSEENENKKMGQQYTVEAIGLDSRDSLS